MRGNFDEISFQAKFLRKARNFVEIRLHYFCTILYLNFFSTVFSPKFELLNSGCGLSASAAHMPVFTVSSKTSISGLIICRAKLLNADWLRQRAFFLNQEGTFGNQEGMIT